MHEGRKLPTITLRENDLPDLRFWGISEEYFVVAKVKLITKGASTEGEDDQANRDRLEGVFQMKSVRALDEKPIDVKMLEREEFDRIHAKARAGELT